LVPAQSRANEAWSARTSRALLQRVSPEPAAAGCVFLWPNTLLQCTADGLAVLQILPLATGLCTYRESRYALPDMAREMQLLRYLQRRVRRQALQADARLLTRVQQGMASGQEPGPIAVNEPGLRWFAARYREQMAGHIGPEPGAVSPRRTRPKRRATVVA
jgi:phenylpropionate dioxygenase-like ring-hydroxylating dioxygenase large terminal subunit